MKWISVNKRLPDDNREVLVYAPNCSVIGPRLIGCYFKAEKNYAESWVVYDFHESKHDELVTHWQELPDKP